MTKKQEKKASVWKQRFENRQQKLQKMHEDAQKYYDIMYAVQNTTKISPWKSKVYVPVLASKAWDLISRMSDVVPLFNVNIKNELVEDTEQDEAGEEVVKGMKLADGVLIHPKPKAITNI
jgi:DNA-binding transcriptional regulator WhiA